MIKILNESGYEEAMLGLSLSYNKPVCEMYKVAKTLYNKDGGHNKFLESIVIWLDITMPRYWWSEADTYRVGTTKQSESTMHTIMKKPLTQDDFYDNIPEDMLDKINKLIKQKNFIQVKNMLPEGFLQRRIVCTNYKVLRHIIMQRKNHKLDMWRKFCTYLQENCRYKEFLHG
jgi:hypothetical protein